MLVIDGWSAGYLSSYGTAWLETPALNQLAAESVLVEHATVETLHLDQLYRSWFQAAHPLAPADGFDLAAQLAQVGVPLHLLTDEALLRDAAGAFALASAEFLPCQEPQIAEHEDDTELARIFAVLCEWIGSESGDELIWAHARGMAGAWDAPLDYRRSLAAEDDPDPPSYAIPPASRPTRKLEPDELLGLSQAYGGQVLLIDTLMEELLAAIHALPVERQPLLIVTSSGGMPLGLHGQIGRDASLPLAIYANLTQAPLTMRLPGGADGLTRLQGLSASSDLPATLLDWFAAAQPERAIAQGRSLLQFDLPGRDRTLCVAGQELYLRTAAWGARVHGNQQCQLFGKPDDRWDVNDVANRCPQITPLAIELAEQTRDAIAQGAAPPELPEELTEPLS
ncbi:hypothetical protein C5Y93_25235 [Blastopirellula marina]|uniref:Sulfatase N-terminal domain-containing protein n=1 Tax=Blastopirellula marina TaxID=124 RepID=A0A2S8GEY0_9BACT|nr:hypothetical protein C5Y93_25235 [Blastopirellula marina]